MTSIKKGSRLESRVLRKQGYYDRMLMLIRNMFEQALKTNSSLQFAVLTGCLRVSKESIFTGLNNLKVFPSQTRIAALISALRMRKSERCWIIIVWVASMS